LATPVFLGTPPPGPFEIRARLLGGWRRAQHEDHPGKSAPVADGSIDAVAVSALHHPTRSGPSFLLGVSLRSAFIGLGGSFMVSGQGRKSIPLSVRLALVGIVVALCSADVPTQSAAQYGIADLGTLGGSSAAASDVSEYGGTMVGQAQTSTGNNSVSEQNWAVALSALALTPSTIAGGKASSARVALTDIPPFSHDAIVRLASSRPDIAPVPSTIVVPYYAGSTSRVFNIIPKVVSEPTPVEISATYGLVTIKQTLTVVPPALSQLYLTPTTIIGGCGTSARSR
jgi:hypothetical protein